MDMKPYIENIISGLISALIILPTMNIVYNRYFERNIQALYHVIETRPPIEGIDKLNGTYQAIKHEKIKLLKIKLKNNSTTPFQLDKFDVYGVVSLLGINYSGKSFNKNRGKEIKASLLDNGGKVKIMNLPPVLPKDEYELFIWGKLYSTNFIQFESRNKSYTANETFIVAGIEKFFAVYWRLIVFMFGILLVGIIYRYKTIIYYYEEAKKKEK